jgi:hypothetical protein
MSIDFDKMRLSRLKMLEPFQRDLNMTEMTTLLLSESNDSHHHMIHCALIPADKIDYALSDPSLDLMWGKGLPGIIGFSKEGKIIQEYQRFGNEDGIEPLIIERDFHGIKDDYYEICEEFRLIHNLFHDRKTDQYIKIDNDGNEQIIAVVESNRVQIRLREIRKYLAVRNMYLSIKYDIRESSRHSSETLKLKEKNDKQREKLSHWQYNIIDETAMGCNYRTFSRLLGIRLIPPLPKSKSGFFYSRENSVKKHVEFIVDIDENGDEVTLKAIPDCSDHLTPVHFRKQVLEKYFQKPSIYSVEESSIWCGSLWGLPIDNNHNDKVCVWLGDLGQLSYNEQLYWKTYNIPPSGGVSETFFKRQIDAEFTNSDRPEHLFQQSYKTLIQICNEHLGWQILKPLKPGDEYHLKCVRIPANNEQRNFDEVVLGLTKILIDSLNEKQLNILINTQQQKNIKGSIAKLEAFFIDRNIQNSNDHIAFLRKLQQLRSSSTAHRKGSNYEKISKQLGIENQDLQTILSEILSQALAFLNFLIDVVRSGHINKKKNASPHNKTKD